MDTDDMLRDCQSIDRLEDDCPHASLHCIGCGRYQCDRCGKILTEHRLFDEDESFVRGYN